MSGILVILEQPQGMSIEALAAAQQIASELSLPVYAAIVANDGAAVAAYKVDKVHAIAHPLLAEYTSDGYKIALKQLIEQHRPSGVLFPHTYQVRDFAPALAASLGRVLVSDVIGHRVENGSLVLVRQLFQGKLNADVRFHGEGPWFASIQAGAFRAENAAKGDAPAPVETVTPAIEAAQIRTKPLERFRESQRAVDLGAAERIVSVGRGIREQENIALVEDLAKAMGAELAASRPICDNGWLPMERQVGSSGQTVAPKLYVAVGISVAIQHQVGMK